MSKATNLIGLGVPAEVAATSGSSQSITVSAAGSALSDATQLSTADVINVSTVASSTGVKLNSSVPQDKVIFVRNGGANNLKVYPATSAGVINGGSAGAAVTLATSGKHIGVFLKIGNDTWLAGDIASAS